MSSSIIEETNDKPLYISFNQDYSCFSVGTERGFKIFSVYPIKDYYERILNGGIGIVEMLYKTNLLALVGGGSNPKFDINNVVIWDDSDEKILCVLKFPTNIKSIKLRKDKLFVICENRMFLINTINFKNIDVEDTYPNPRGLIGINNEISNTIYAFPYKDSKGVIKIKYLERDRELLIKLDCEEISFISMNKEGSLIALSSEAGNFIKIYRCIDGLFLQDLRRGKEKAEICSIIFDNKNRFIMASSDRGTIHIWSLSNSASKIDCSKNDYFNETMPGFEGLNNKSKKEDNKIDLPKNNTSILSGLFGLFKGELSFAKIKIDSVKSLCAFGPGDVVIIVSYDCKYYEGNFDQIYGGDGIINTKINLNEVK